MEKNIDQNQQKLQILASIDLFKDLKLRELEVLSSIIRQEVIQKDEFIIKEGEHGKILYILKDGNVEILKDTLSGDNYTVATLGHEHHAFFGEMALVADDKRSASIKALTICELYTISKDDFLLLGDNHPHLGLLITREIAKILANRIRKSTSDVVTLFQALVDEVEGE